MFFKNRKIKKLKQEIDELVTVVGEKSLKIKELQEDKKFGLDKIREYVDQLYKWQDDFADLNLSYSRLEKENIDLKQENAIIDSKLMDLEKEHNINGYEREIRSLNGEINSLRAENQKLRRLMETINFKTQDIKNY